MLNNIGHLTLKPARSKPHVVFNLIQISCKEIDNNPLFPRFSISTKILNHFEVSLFSFLAFPADTGQNELPSPSRKTCNLIAGKRKRWQSDKP